MFWSDLATLAFWNLATPGRSTRQGRKDCAVLLSLLARQKAERSESTYSFVIIPCQPGTCTPCFFRDVGILPQTVYGRGSHCNLEKSDEVRPASTPLCLRSSPFVSLHVCIRGCPPLWKSVFVAPSISLSLFSLTCLLIATALGSRCLCYAWPMTIMCYVGAFCLGSVLV